MTQPYQYESSIAVAAVSEAALLTRAVQSELGAGVIEKQDRSPVTIADFGSQALICRMIKASFPDDPIIAEENADVLRDAAHASAWNQVVRHVQRIHPTAQPQAVLNWIDYGDAHQYSSRFWTLDPIDGTKGFLRGEQYAIALALIVDGEVCVAALACPNLSDPQDDSRGGVYFATKGGGAMRAPLDASGPSTPIHCSKRQDPATALFCESVESGHSSHDDAATVADFLHITTDPVRLDSQAKYAVVAHGIADIYLRLPASKTTHYVEKIWDHAAGSLVIAEAGGQVTDITGKPLDFRCGHSLERNQGIIATNGVLHHRVLAAVEAAGVTHANL